MNPVGIILHYIGNPNTSASQNANYFSHLNAQTSVNYIVDESEIIEIIPPNMKSYGTSNGAYNNRYIQIEMCHKDSTGVISELTIKNTVDLCRELIKKYSCADIIRHYDVTGKKCPLWYVEHPVEWEKLKKRILSRDDEDTMTYEDFKQFIEQYNEETRQKKASDYALNAWNKVQKLKIMDGTSPQGSLTREQFAVILERLKMI